MKNILYIILILLLNVGFKNYKLENIEDNLNSFNMIYKYYNVDLYCDECINTDDIDLLSVNTVNYYFQTNPMLVSSSFIVKKNKKYSILMTSNHVCKSIFDEEKEKREVDSIKKLITISSSKIKEQYIKVTPRIFIENNKKKRTAIIKKIYSNEESDICTFLSKNVGGSTVSLQKENDNPTSGDLIYNISGMLGIRSNDSFLIFTGIYSGLYEKYSFLSTVFSKPGSSGSPVFNSKGYLIGVIHTTYSKVNNISISTSLESVKKAIKYSDF